MDLFPQLYRLTERDEQTLLIQPESGSLTITWSASGTVVGSFPSSFPGLDRAFKIQRLSWAAQFPAPNTGSGLTSISVFVVDAQGSVRDIIEARSGGFSFIRPPELSNVDLVGGATVPTLQWTSALAEEFLVRPGGRVGMAANLNSITTSPVSLTLNITGIAIPPGGIGR